MTEKTEMNVQVGFNVVPLSGHLVLDGIGGENRVQCSPLNIDAHVRDGECTRLVADNVLDYIHISQLESAINGWVRKLRHGGTIVLGGTDITEVSKKIIRREYNIPDINILLNGQGYGNYVYGCYDLEFINKILLSLGLKIMTKRIDNCKFVIEGKRP